MPARLSVPNFFTHLQVSGLYTLTNSPRPSSASTQLCRFFGWRLLPLPTYNRSFKRTWGYALRSVDPYIAFCRTGMEGNVYATEIRSKPGGFPGHNVDLRERKRRRNGPEWAGVSLRTASRPIAGHRDRPASDNCFRIERCQRHGRSQPECRRSSDLP